MSNKQATSIRLSPEAKSLLLQLARKLSVSQAAIIEIAIRNLAQQYAITPNDEGSNRD